MLFEAKKLLKIALKEMSDAKTVSKWKIEMISKIIV